MTTHEGGVGDAVLHVERLTREAVEPRYHMVGDLEMSTRLLIDNRPKEVEPAHLEVRTLQALLDYIGSEIDDAYLETKKAFVHVAGPALVRFNTELFGVHHQRVTLMCAKMFDGPVFEFGAYMNQEMFIIGLQTCFVRTGDFDPLLSMVSGLMDEHVTEGNDDGVSQQVGVRRGVTTVGMEKVVNPVTLTPFRTFPEIGQPASRYVVRFRGGGEGKIPLVALFEVPDGLWRLEATNAIQAFLKAQISQGIPVFA